MLNHSKSLFLSLAIHTLILLSLVGVYKYVFPSSKPAQQEKKICVNLTCIKQKAVVYQEHKIQKQKVKKTKPLHKKIVKKPVIHKKAPVQKPKRVKKKVPLKKEIKKEEQKVVEKSVEPMEPVQSVDADPVKEQLQVEKKVEVSKENVQNIVSEQEKYLQDNLAIIAQLIKENLYYPRMARKRGIQGSVTVRFMLLKDATVTQITTISSSSGILTRAAIKTIAELSGKFPKPKTDLMLTVPIIYSLH